MRAGSPESDAAWPVVHMKVGRDAPPPALPACPPTAGMMIVAWEGDRALGQRILKPGETRLDVASLVAWAEELASRHGEEEAGSAIDTRSLSVIIPTRDRPQDLARMLESLATQSVRPDEIIVVDNAPQTDATRAVVAERAGTDGRVIYVAEPRAGLDFARNAGVRAARSDILAFCDDDVVLHERWCEALIGAFDRPDIMAATGLVLPLELATQAQRIFEFEWGFGRGYKRIDFGPEFFARTRARGCPTWDIGAGASMAFLRRAFAEVGFFDERLDAGAAGCSGDSEIWYRLLARGWTCRYEPSAVSFHRHRRSDEELRRQIRAYMRGHVVALFIQFQRHRHWGNLGRVFWTLPSHYLVRFLRILKRGATPGDRLLNERVLGSLGGVLYFARHWRLEPPKLMLEPGEALDVR